MSSYVNAPWPECSPCGVDSYDPGEDLLSDPHNFHSNPGYMGTSTASAAQASQPGSIYRTAGPHMPMRSPRSSGDEGHRPMRLGGPRPIKAPGRTVLAAGPAREPVSEGSPLLVSTGAAQW